MKLFKYDEFITESNLDFLLEAKMDFSDDFMSVLKNIDLPIAKKLASINSNEVDINQNYIDINKDKSDTVFFKPDDKVGKTAMYKPVFFSVAKILDCVFIDLSKIPGSGISAELAQPKGTTTLVEDDIVQVIKEMSNEMSSYISAISEMSDEKIDGVAYSGQDRSRLLKSIIDLGDVHLIQWFKNGKKYQTIAPRNALDMSSSVIRNSEISIGRFTRACLKKSSVEFKDSEIEEFVYKYKAEIEKIKNVLDLRFKIVQGQDIKTYYHRSKYVLLTGNLGNSCMRYDECQKYFDIYTENSQVKLLLFMSDIEEDKICGRAILWEMEPYELSTKVMDRIYTNQTADEELFKQWAIKNGYWYKKEQTYSDYTEFLFNKEDGTIERRQGEFSVKLDNKGEYNYYPYMDSFKYYEPKTGVLYNSSNFDHEYELTETGGGNGSCGECGGGGTIGCGDCDGEGVRDCLECDGNGNDECDDCSGRGKQECHICDGVGENECSTCDGQGEGDCEYCGGQGEIEGEECVECVSGKKSCEECSGEGKKECYKCDGDGDLECRECDGDGYHNCEYCDGSGTCDCSECDGSGSRDCYQCN